MHLTDEQLLELDEISKQHLIECNECKQRVDILLNIRQQLTQQKTMPKFEQNWQEIKQGYQREQQKKSETKIIFWRFSALAFAAAFVFMTVLPLFKAPSINGIVDENEITLANWVEQNKQAQQQLEQQLSSNLLLRVQFNQLQVQLTDIDKALQQVYLLNKGTSEKIKLWQQRKKAIDNSLKKMQQTHIISI